MEYPVNRDQYMAYILSIIDDHIPTKFLDQDEKIISFTDNVKLVFYKFLKSAKFDIKYVKEISKDQIITFLNKNSVVFTPIENYQFGMFFQYYQNNVIARYYFNLASSVEKSMVTLSKIYDEIISSFNRYSFYETQTLITEREQIHKCYHYMFYNSYNKYVYMYKLYEYYFCLLKSSIFRHDNSVGYSCFVKDNLWYIEDNDVLQNEKKEIIDGQKNIIDYPYGFTEEYGFNLPNEDITIINKLGSLISRISDCTDNHDDFPNSNKIRECLLKYKNMFFYRGFYHEMIKKDSKHTMIYKEYIERDRSVDPVQLLAFSCMTGNIDFGTTYHVNLYDIISQDTINYISSLPDNSSYPSLIKLLHILNNLDLDGEYIREMYINKKIKLENIFNDILQGIVNDTNEGNYVNSIYEGIPYSMYKTNNYKQIVRITDITHNIES